MICNKNPTGTCLLKTKCEHACALRVQPVIDALAAKDDQARPLLKGIGEQIGYGNAQSILGELWDEPLQANYGIPPIRGRMGISCNESAAYRRGWDACMEQWAKHMKRMAVAIKTDKTKERT